MRLTFLSFLLLPLLSLSACHSTGGATCCDPQTVIESVATSHPGCTRLSVHCTPAGASGMVACASTSADRRGKPSDPEDMQVVKSGKQVVMEQGGDLDVTIPICMKDGAYTAACGVTLKRSGAMTREQLVAEAEAIAKAVEAGMGTCGTSCCK